MAVRLVGVAVVTPTLRGPRAAAAWAVEAALTLPAALRSTVPGAPVPAALREDVLVAVAHAHGASAMAWVHEGWRSFAGRVPDGDVRLALAAHARAVAAAGHPAAHAALEGVLPPSAVRGVRAVAVRGRVEAEVEARTRRVIAAVLTGRLSPGTVVDLPLAALGVAAAAPALVTGAVLGALARRAPPVPEVEGADDPAVGLLGALAAEAVPVLLGNAAVRAVVLGSPTVLSIGLRSGASTATVRVGRGRAEVVDGIDADVLVVLQGDVEPLVRLAAGVVLREAIETVPHP